MGTLQEDDCDTTDLFVPSGSNPPNINIAGFRSIGDIAFDLVMKTYDKYVSDDQEVAVMEDTIGVEK